MSFRVYNRWIVVINDATAVRDLLERRANIYSDRPKSWMYHELCDRKKSVFNVSSRDERHMHYRKLLKNGLGSRVIPEYWPILEAEVDVLLQGLAQSSEDYTNIIRR